MKKVLAVVAFLWLAVCGARADGLAVTNLVAGNNAFAFDLYGKLAAADGNLFFSPYSISACLGMTFAGARGDTAQEMARTLHFDVDSAVLPGAFNALQKHFDELERATSVELNIANGIWAQEDHALLKGFQKTLREQYEAELKQVNFRAHADSVRGEINGWVSTKTHDKINDLLPSGAIDATTRLVLVNAIYFKGKWEVPFKATATAEAPFHLSSSEVTQAKLMHEEGYFKYGETADLQVIELPYTTGNSTNGRFAMDVLLPKSVDGLKTMEGTMSEASVTEWLGQATQQKVKVALPKFKTTKQFGLGDTLAAMGMPLAFSGQADFSGMDGLKDLHISAVVHKAFVEVDETGTEAAAATGTVMAMTSVMAHPVKEFRADHPFLFLIRDTESGAILFMGRMVDPTK